MLEVLHGALMLLGRRARLERSKILPLPGLALLARVQTIPAILQLPNHAASCAKLTARNTGRRDRPMATYAPPNSSKARKSSPPRKLPVTSRTMPMVYGATKPAIAPSELMSAIPAAAASSPRKSDGIAQVGP